MESPRLDEGKHLLGPRMAVEGLVSFAALAGRALVGSVLVAHKPCLEDGVEGKGILVNTCLVVGIPSLSESATVQIWTKQNYAIELK